MKSLIYVTKGIYIHTFGTRENIVMHVCACGQREDQQELLVRSYEHVATVAMIAQDSGLGFGAGATTPDPGAQTLRPRI